MNKNRNEQGGVVAFLVVGVLLASALLGGIYIAKQQGQAARSNSAAEESQQIQKNAEEAQPKPEEKAENSSQSGSGTESTTETDTTKTTGSQTVAVTGPSDVPSTGPEDTLAIVAVIAAGVLGVWYYTASRRSLVRSALR